MSVFVLSVMGVSQVSGLMLAGIAELSGNVALTVGIWTMVGWCLLVGVRLAHLHLSLEPQVAMTEQP
jgi:hypothetical protein